MATHIFYLVDVFAQEKYSGNQLAVVTDAGNLSDGEMQRIANEFHFSETSFIVSQSGGCYDVRIFTPSTEVAFAGHPTIGTAYVIKRFIEKKNVEQVILRLKIGQIPVTFASEVTWMQQKPPIFGKTFPGELFQNLLGLNASDFDLAYPIQLVSTGLPFIIVPLKTLDSVRKARINQDFLPILLKLAEAGVLVFCPQTYNKTNKLNVRVFVDAFGISEDPATGSGNGCLAAYLSKYRYFGEQNIEIAVEQGYEINRPSILHLKTRVKKDSIAVQVGGRVQLVAKGELTEQ
jgi:trans-2,3-dihydro-3-hydroxyanthranilate isomerase